MEKKQSRRNSRPPSIHGLGLSGLGDLAEKKWVWGVLLALLVLLLILYRYFGMAIF